MDKLKRNGKNLEIVSRTNKNLTEEEKSKIIELYLSGKYYKYEIAKILNRSLPTINVVTNNYCRENNIVPNNRKFDEKTIEKAIDMYYSKKYTVKEIIEITGISRSSFYTYLNRHKKKLNKLESGLDKEDE